MTIDFSTVLFTDSTSATLDWPDGLSKGWVANGCVSARRVVIIDGIMVGPWRVPEGVKMIAETYIVFFKDHLKPWFKRQRITFKRTMMFIQGNAPSLSALKTSEHLPTVVFSGSESNCKLMECLEEASLSWWTPIFIQRSIMRGDSGCCTWYYCWTDPMVTWIYGWKAQERLLNGESHISY